MSRLPPKSLFRAWNEPKADPVFADAIALLTADHRMIENLLATFARGHRERRCALLQPICAALKNHAMIEEDILLPALHGLVASTAIDEARLAHAQMRALVAAMEADRSTENVQQLAKEVGFRLGAEEEPRGGLFSCVRATGINLIALRDAMLARKASSTNAGTTANP